MTMNTLITPQRKTPKKLALKKDIVRYLTAHQAARLVGRAGRAPTANCTQIGPTCGSY